MCLQNDGLKPKKTGQGDTKQDDTNILYMKDFLSGCNTSETIFTLKTKVIGKNVVTFQYFQIVLFSSGRKCREFLTLNKVSNISREKD